YDIVLIGAGIHAAIFVYTIKQQRLYLNILIIEETQNICSTFAKMGDAMILNSPTFTKVGLNSNIIQGHFIQLTDFDDLSELPFPTGTHIHDITAMVFFHADADIIFQTRADAIVDVGDSHHVVCSDTRVQANQVVISNGMGRQRTLPLGKNKTESPVLQGDDFLA
ncbi:unnamed protein product, partial [Ectocarpus fasciculatus]